MGEMLERPNGLEREMAALCKKRVSVPQGRVSLPQLSSDSSLLRSAGMKTSAACILLCLLAISLSPAGESLHRGRISSPPWLAPSSFLHRLMCNE